ncbi:HMCN1 [Bugula neritina]|uniref:HMCN1 n=1 Tax=Bugula neritina TaxID=10212 RepID=A0A7J7K884_BUGNE|nr:HMCN1 [Bugula neritina]
MFCIEKRVRWKNFLIYFLGIHILISTVESQSGLGEWGGWGACSVSCAGGDQMRTRPCLDTRLCGGPVSEGRNCNNVPCPIHGAWEAWESWISCTKTCGGGTSARKRSCDAPSPSFGGRFCEGGVPENIDNESVEWQWRACNTHRCEGDRGTGPLPAVVLPTLAPKFTTARSRVPLASAPTPPPVAQPRPPPPVRQPSPPVRQPSPSVRQPSLQPGAQPGWSAWGAWGACSASCAGGDRTRTRVCLDNRFCSGTEPNSENCNNVPCPIHGAWEAWESWISCTKTCGGGTSARKRSCDAPSPSFGGGL